MRDYMKSFFSLKRAEKFMEVLIGNGTEDVIITSARNAFGESYYRVEWNYSGDEIVRL